MAALPDQPMRSRFITSLAATLPDGLVAREGSARLTNGAMLLILAQQEGDR